jgi:DNA-3-methyladenine glycosylase II
MSDGPFERLQRDPHLGPVPEAYSPVTIEPAVDTFARFIIAILNQQLSTHSAAAIQERLFDMVEVRPESMLAAENAKLREAGLSHQKIRYVRNVADAYQSGKISIDRYAGFSDDEMVADLTEITGVGNWTARIFLMFIL